MVEIRPCRHERALALGHLLAINGQEAVDMNLCRQAVAGRLEHAGPEQRVKVSNVLADEMVNPAVRRAPPIIEPLAMPIAPLLCGRHVTDRRVVPDVPEVAGTVGDLKPK